MMMPLKNTVTILLTGSCLALMPAIPSQAGSAAGDKTTANDVPDGDQLPSVYVVPLKGQMGTDIHEDTIDEVIEDIKAQPRRPDIVVLKINSSDFGRNFHLPQIDPSEFGMFALEAYRALVRNLHNNLPSDIQQVVWVEDSVGLATLLALSWCDMYMAPDARLYGLNNIFDVSQGWGDADVREKMEEAWEGIGRGFLNMGCLGQYARALGGAMMDPSKTLSADFKGREVVWRPDTDGEWVIDSDPEGVANFEATDSEDTLLCNGLAESIDDLLFLMGHREYELNTSGEELVETYMDRWRKAYKNCYELLADMEAGRLRGDTQLELLNAQLNVWGGILSNMLRYGAVERRLEREIGLNIVSIELRIEQLKDQIRQIRDSDRGGGRVGGGGGGGISGGGGKGRP